MSVSDAERIDQRITALNEADQKRQEKALSEGYGNAVCAECRQVFLAFHHFVRCDSKTCPMVARDTEGNRKESLLEQLTGHAEK